MTQLWQTGDEGGEGAAGREGLIIKHSGKHTHTHSQVADIRITDAVVLKG